MSNPNPPSAGDSGTSRRSPPSSRSALQPRLEVLATVVALGSIVVRTNAGDVKRVVTKLAEDERRGLDHVVDRRQLLLPVHARTTARGWTPPAPAPPVIFSTASRARSYAAFARCASAPKASDRATGSRPALLLGGGLHRLDRQLAFSLRTLTGRDLPGLDRPISRLLLTLAGGLGLMQLPQAADLVQLALRVAAGARG